MDILIDGKHVDLADAGVRSAGEVFDRVDRWAADNGRCVVGVTIDGREIGTDQLGTIALRPAEAFDRFEFTTQPTAELIASLTGELETKIEELSKLVHQLATAFQGESETPPVSALAEVVNAWQGVLERLVSAATLLRVDLDALEVPGTGLAGEHHGRVTDMLGKLVSAVEQEDLVLVADLLEYEVAPGIERETAVLASLRHAAASLRTD